MNHTITPPGIFMHGYLAVTWLPINGGSQTILTVYSNIYHFKFPQDGHFGGRLWGPCLAGCAQSSSYLRFYGIFSTTEFEYAQYSNHGSLYLLSLYSIFS